MEAGYEPIAEVLHHLQDGSHVGATITLYINGKKVTLFLLNQV